VPHGSVMGQTHANLGWFGMTSVKPFGMLVEAKGEGVSGSGDLVIGSSGDRKSKIQTLTPIGIGMGQTYANLG
jgi:hypothetical protein